ncbi:hypothetical protein A3K55_02075 [Candidatus Shapirobacteria bacterium RBG_13_44_7]|uniref:Glycosyltransferase RgtA/B/C/D-like domain-containing protein n=1 Tax=Candidatus Shapirobacteria bacterium RBG_13_44_7 TaxID=1802149 RepID=A0A1F7SHM4_9BACT|nr:MAG: hypothetical protein A3K55_02075 [Candidatus Shapirobacteria bacterium RBG_13_44_7]
MKIFLILLLALSFRLYGLNWDQGYYFHPDERMIVMVTDKIKLPATITDFFHPSSPLNPQFFAYGSFPIYLLRFLSWLLAPISPLLASYAQMNLVGRVISAIFDTLSVLLIYKICLLTFKSKSTAYLASILYALSVLPVQLSHFYAVDTTLNFFILLTLYWAINLYLKPNLKSAIFVGISFGLALATKISATVLLLSISLALIVEFLLSLKKEIIGFQTNIFSILFHRLQKIIHPRYWFHLLLLFLIIFLITIIVFIINQPYALIDFSTFWRQIKEQNAMTKDAFVFPYTLQYVGTTPFLYQLKNIFLWGQGPILGVISVLGFIFTLTNLIRGFFHRGNEKSEACQLILFSFFLAYFFIVGQFAIKFMRYCLPLYPLFSIFAANFLISLRRFLLPIFILGHLLWLIAFLAIYRQPNTRVTASIWTQNHIPPGSLILREHWDDGLPVGYNRNYRFIDLPLYDPDDDPQKWQFINQSLQMGDYLIIASNRLYTPLQKLTDCSQLPPHRCYPKTAKYYQDLFAGKLDYQLVANFESYPSLFGYPINDQAADESFTVYDHPKILIFQRL